MNCGGSNQGGLVWQAITFPSTVSSIAWQCSAATWQNTRCWVLTRKGLCQVWLPLALSF